MSNIVPALFRSCQGGSGLPQRDGGSCHWKASCELERPCVRGVDACVRRSQPLPAVQLCVFVCLLQTSGTGISSWGSFVYGGFYRSAGKSSVPTLFGLNWGMLGKLNTVGVTWWGGQGEEG